MQLILAVFFVCVQMAYGGKSNLPSKQHWGYQIKKCTPKVKPNLCKSCLLDKDNIDGKDGKFFNIERVYLVEEPKCQAALAEYVEDNAECDTMTAKCLPKWLKEGDEVCRQRLDRILYTVCELCCDCIPKGAKPGDYTLDVKRDNCPLHFDADNCNYFPDAYNNICDLVDESYKNKNALKQVHAFLEDIMIDYGCADKQVWDVCHHMESSQKRI